MSLQNTIDSMIASRQGFAERLARGKSFRKQTPNEKFICPSRTGFVECQMTENDRREIQAAIDKLDLAIRERHPFPDKL